MYICPLYHCSKRSGTKCPFWNSILFKVTTFFLIMKSDLHLIFQNFRVNFWLLCMSVFCCSFFSNASWTPDWVRGSVDGAIHSYVWGTNYLPLSYPHSHLHTWGDIKISYLFTATSSQVNTAPTSQNILLFFGYPCPFLTQYISRWCLFSL